jgi:PilZ domain
MNATVERRNSDRHPCDCEASWSYFNKEGAAAGRILNFSRSGSYLEIDQPMIPGATVLIRILTCSAPAAAHPDALPLNAVAEVKWCREIDRRATSRHGAGVRYHFPV